MAKLYNLGRMTTVTTGTGTITLGAAVSGFLTFAQAGVADGDVVAYGIADGANSEVGTGTYAAAGTTLTRAVTRSTNANAAISLSGSAQVFVTPRKEDLISASESQSQNTVLAAPNGSAGAPTFRALVPADIPANTGITLLSTLTAGNSASLTDATDITSTYDFYMFALRDVRPVTNNAGLQMQYSSDGGATWLASYQSTIYGVVAALGATLKLETSGSGVMLSGANASLDGISNSANQGVNGVIYLHHPASLGVKHVTGQVAYSGGDGTQRLNVGTIGANTLANATAVNAVKFFMTSGNISSGEIKVYGIKTA